MNQEPAKSESQPQTSIQQANVPTVSTKTAGDTESTVPAGIDGTVTEQGKDGTSNYFITDKGTLYFTDGSLDKDATQAIGLKHSKDVLAVDTSLASPNSVYAPEDSSYLFAGDNMATHWNSTESMNLSNLNTSKVTNMSNMFSELKYLTEINLSNFDTSNVTDMSYMFWASPYISSLNLNSFNTSKVTDMRYMFNDLIYLKELRLANFDTRKVSSDNMKNIFDISRLSEIELGPNADFSRAKPSYLDFYVPQDGTVNGMAASYWINSVNGKEGNLKFSTSNLLTDYKAKPDETETFIMGGLYYSQQVRLNEVDYLNGKLYSRSPVYPLSIGSNDILKSDLHKIQNTNIPSDWTLDPTISTLTTDNTNPASIDKLKKIIVSEEPEYQNLPLNLKNIVTILKDMFTNSAYNGKTFTLKMCYTGSLPVHNPKPSSNSNHDYLPITSLIQTVATFADKPAVQLWSFDRNTSSITPVTNRELAPDSNWYSDRTVTVDNIDYLRVATNEWVKSNDVYRYITNPTNIIVNNNSQGFASLYKAEGTNVTDRTLSNGSNWYSDYIAYLGKNDDTKQSNDSQDKYYRVATNEFVKMDDTTE